MSKRSPKKQSVDKEQSPAKRNKPLSNPQDVETLAEFMKRQKNHIYKLRRNKRYDEVHLVLLQYSGTTLMEIPQPF
jgi:hypothetical protein